MRGRAPGGTAQIGTPLAVKQCLPIGHQRPLHLDHHLMPFAVGLARHPELVSDPGAAYYAQALIHQQQLAMIAVQVAQPAPQAHGVVPAQLHPSHLQPLALALGKGEAAIAVEQTPHGHPASSSAHQCFDDLIGAGTGFDQIQFQIDLRLRSIDRGEHARKKLRAINQQLEAVAAAPRKNRTGH